MNSDPVATLDTSVFPVDNSFPTFPNDAFPSDTAIAQQTSTTSTSTVDTNTGSMGAQVDMGFPMSSADIASQLGLDSTSLEMSGGGMSAGSGMVIANPTANNNFLPDLPQGGQFVNLISGITQSFSPDVFGSGQVNDVVNLGTSGLDPTLGNTGFDTLDAIGAVDTTGTTTTGPVFIDQGGFDQTFNSGLGFDQSIFGQDQFLDSTSTIISGQEPGGVVPSTPVDNLQQGGILPIAPVNLIPGHPNIVDSIGNGKDPGLVPNTNFVLGPDTVLGQPGSEQTALGMTPTDPSRTGKY